MHSWFDPPARGFADARWFATDLHLPGRWVGFLHLDDAALHRNVFLDSRIDAPWQRCVQVPLDALAEQELPQARVGWLLHTSFCCSTLLARMLFCAPYCTALREPLLLRRLADARFADWPLAGAMELPLRLLARPWHEGATVLIKPTHAALNIAAELLQLRPGERALVLTSRLEDFVISNIKKTPETHARVRELVVRALKALGLSQPPATPPDLLCEVALQWAAQSLVVGRLLRQLGAERVRVLQERALLADPVVVSAAANDWLQLGIPAAVLAEQAQRAGGLHAKVETRPYGPAQREHEAAIIRQHYGAEIARALRWADRQLQPWLGEVGHLHERPEFALT